MEPLDRSGPEVVADSGSAFAAADSSPGVAEVTDPAVSVVIVAWRARADVLNCLRSLERHAGVEFEAIVVDDGSGDGTPDAVRADFPMARVVAKPTNEGLVAGRNSALPLIRGRFVLMLDADTELRPGAVPTMAALLAEHPEVGLVGPRLVAPDGEVQPSCRRYPRPFYPLVRRGPLARLLPESSSSRRYWMEDYDHASERPVASVLGAAQMWRAELPTRIGEYDRRLSSYGGEDLDWCHRVWAAGLEVRYAPQAEIVHRWQRVTRQSPYSGKSFRQLWDYYYLQWKHRHLRQAPALLRADA